MGESRTNDERCCAVRNSWLNNPLSVIKEKGISIASMGQKRTFK